MLRIQPFRRPSLTSPEGCDVPGWRFATAPACHKGNAGESQSETQTGAQTQGAVSGAAATGGTNTGTQVAKAPIVSGTNNSVNTGTPITSNGAVTISQTDDGAVKSALSALSLALQQANTTTQDTIAAAAALQQPPAQPDPSAVSATMATVASTGPTISATPGTVTSGLASLTTWQLFAAVASIVGFLYLLLKGRRT